MNSIQIADETFVAADPAEVGRAVGDPASWRDDAAANWRRALAAGVPVEAPRAGLPTGSVIESISVCACPPGRSG